MPFPACDALIVHVPAPVMCTFAGEVAGVTVHWPDVTENVTGRPDVAVAVIWKSALPKP